MIKSQPGLKWAEVPDVIWATLISLLWQRGPEKQTSEKTMRRLAIFGATGRTGRLLLGLSESKALQVNALARLSDSLSNLKNPPTVTKGTITDPKAVETVVAGSDAVLCALGRDKSSPPDLMTVASRNMVSAMSDSGIRRIVVLTNTAIVDQADSLSLQHKLLRGALSVANGSLKRDSVAAAKIISDSGLDWTLVRAPVLTDGPRTGAYRVGRLDRGIPLRVSRADVAEFMLSCVLDWRYVREMPAIGGAG